MVRLRLVEYLGLVFFLVLYIFPVFSQNAYYLGIMILAFIYLVLAEATGLMAGQLGWLSLAQTAFWGIGAYVSALLVMTIKEPFLVGFIMAGIISAIVAFLVGTQFLKVNRQAFGTVTLAFLIITQLIAYNWTDVTRGSLGLPRIPQPNIMGIAIVSQLSFYYLYLIIASVAVLFVYGLIRSRVGRAFLSIREDELLAESVGVDCFRYKLLGFTISAFIAGIAGSMYAHFATFIGPDVLFDFYFVTIVLVMVVVGGIDSPIGIAVASVVFSALPELLRFSGVLRDATFGILLILILTVPKGKINIRKLLKASK